MAGRYLDLLGTLFSKFQIGLGGPQLKNNGGTVEARNPGDSAYAQMRMLLAAITGDDIVLNEQATSSGSSYKFTLRRPSTGMTHDLTVVMPSGDPSVGQALTVASFAGNVITLQWTTIAAGAEKLVTDTTTITAGSAASVAMYTAPANAVEAMFQVIIDTPFDAAPQLSIGIAGTPSKYVGANLVDLTYPAKTIFEICPGEPAVGTTENLIATFSAGGATTGSARIIGYYAVPA